MGKSEASEGCNGYKEARNKSELRVLVKGVTPPISSSLESSSFKGFATPTYEIQCTL